jgi:predicted DNA-binding helix-hairpin-helix protein
MAADVHDRLAALADASRYDVSCACGQRNSADHRRRGADGLWLYPVSVPRGGTSVMLKTLLSNECVNDCRYCPFRRDRDRRRCGLEPEEVARAFISYVRQGKIHGLFLSSAVTRDADHAMQRIVATAEIIRRKHEFGGYLHLKVMPGASDGAVEAALSVANCVSLNVEAPTRSAFSKLSTTKDYERDVVRPVRLISKLTARGNRHEDVCQMTQFVVGAAGESDRDIVRATHGLYDRLGLDRVYFSAYQRGLGDPDLPAEQAEPAAPGDVLTREHRLYQVDFLLRRYGFEGEEIPFQADGRLSLERDPKELWAERHPEHFPLDVNAAGPGRLLRVPGFGPVTVKRILEFRRTEGRITRLAQVGCTGRRLQKAAPYVTFGYGVRRLKQLPLTA